MPRTVEQAIQQLREQHPELFDSERTVSIAPYHGPLRSRILVSLHHAPNRLPAWLDLLGLTADDLTREQVIDSIHTRTADSTWRGHRISVASFEDPQLAA